MKGIYNIMDSFFKQMIETELKGLGFEIIKVTPWGYDEEGAWNAWVYASSGRDPERHYEGITQVEPWGNQYYIFYSGAAGIRCYL